VINAEVMRQMEEELRARPKIPDGILFALALQIDPSLLGMDPRTFDAHYVAPARRAVSPAVRPKRKPRPSRRAAAAPSRARPAPAAEPEVPRAAESAPRATAAAAGTGEGEPATRARAAAHGRTARRPSRAAAPPAATVEADAAGQVAAPGAPRVDRERVRAALLAFAVDLAAAEGAAALVRVFERMDGHLDQALGGSRYPGRGR
jgi:hypothetical protein